MKTPVSWLRDFTPLPDDLDALVDACNELGFVVDGVERVGAGLEDVVVARVTEIAAISGADRIRRVVVDTGNGEPLQVVCGAFNFDEGDHVAFIGAGGTLPGGMEIGRRKMKGVESNGMICSTAELELGDDHAGILVLPPTVAPGTSIVAALGLEPDVVLDLDIETNRPDAMCMAGVARDLAARFALPFAIPEPPAVVTSGNAPPLRVDAPDLCPRFTATILSNVRVAPSPPWMARRLELAGMRPINNLVDISNYVMLELGQPTHPYDLERLAGGGISVRRARPGETLTTLDGTERTLGDGDDCLICDAKKNAVGIAGVMGGASSEISDGTTTVLLEAAWFSPIAVAFTSKRLGLRSEASARFERGVDYGGVDRAVARFVELATELAGGQVGGAADFRDDAHLPHIAPIRLRTARVNEILGTALTDDEVRGYLEPIGFAAVLVEPGVHDVTVPTYRLDVNAGEINLIEEVARHHGYENIPKTLPVSPRLGGLTPYQRDRRRVRDVLAGCGIDEAATSLLIGPGEHARTGLPEDGIEADRPLLREQSVLRTSLMPGLLRAVAFNAAHRNGDVALFEIGHVFRRPATEQTLPDEHERIGVVLAGQDASGAVHALRTLLDTLRIADIAITAATFAGGHPGRAAAVSVSGRDIGVVGEVDPGVLEAWDITSRVAWLDLNLEDLFAAPRRPLEMEPVSRFPSSDVDLAFIVDDAVAAAAVEATLRQAGGELLVALELFDVYRGEGVPAGSRSLAYRLRFQAQDRTLTDDEVGAARRACIDAVVAAHGAQLRG
ncbi:MAG TPA: phenylalanine--tRNA ligase subunit beta [Acidimicrobiales bacterium]|nr:phenylalanine--tRNA ligase subunit beta [Acidimicrobiales bacterium]